MRACVYSKSNRNRNRGVAVTCYIVSGLLVPQAFTNKKAQHTTGNPHDSQVSKTSLFSESGPVPTRTQSRCTDPAAPLGAVVGDVECSHARRRSYCPAASHSEIAMRARAALAVAPKCSPPTRALEMTGTIVPAHAWLGVEPHHPFRSTWCRPLEDIMVLSVKSSHVSHIGLRCCCVLCSAAAALLLL